MGFLGSLLGTNSQYQAQGVGQTPGTQALQNPVTGEQANQTLGQANQGLSQQQALINALQGQNGIQNQSNVFNQLQGVANGTGPNPAQAELAQATGANVANQAALMAGQRGAGANAGLLARQAAMQGGNIQQNAAGQAATLQANQSLNALNSLGGQAQAEVGNLGNAIGGYNQGAQSLYGQQLGGINAQNNANISATNAANQINAGVAGQNAQNNGAVFGSILNAAGSAAGPKKAHGGMIEGAYAKGGEVHHMLEHMRGNKVPVILSPGEKVLSKQEVSKVAAGKADPIKSAKTVPGKAKLKGDSLKNDTYHTKLESGGIVIPRSVVNSKDPHKEAAKFVQAVLAQKGLSK